MDSPNKNDSQKTSDISMDGFLEANGLGIDSESTTESSSESSSEIKDIVENVDQSISTTGELDEDGDGYYYIISAINTILEIEDKNLRDRYNYVLDYARPIFKGFGLSGHSGGSAGMVIPCIEHCLETGGEGIKVTEDTLAEVKEAINAYKNVPHDRRADLKLLVSCVLRHYRMVPITLEDGWVNISDDGTYQNSSIGSLFYDSSWGLAYYLDGFYSLEKTRYTDEDGKIVDSESASSSSDSIRFINVPSKNSEQKLFAWDLPKAIYLKRDANYNAKNEIFAKVVEINNRVRNGDLKGDSFDWPAYERLISDLAEAEKAIEFVEEDTINLDNIGAKTGILESDAIIGVSDSEKAADDNLNPPLRGMRPEYIHVDESPYMEDTPSDPEN